MEHDSEYSQEYNPDRKAILVKCKVCQIWCDTMDQFYSHQKSVKHIKKAEKLHASSKYTPLSNIKDNAKSMINDSVTPDFSVLNLENQMEQDSEYSKEYNPDRKAFLVRCKVCQIWCDTKDQFDIHQKSVKHIKKAEQLQSLSSFTKLSMTMESSQSSTSDSVSSDFFCHICNISCLSKEQLTSHFLGQSHKKKSLKDEYKDWKSADIPICNDSFKPESESSRIYPSTMDKVTPITKDNTSSSQLSPNTIRKILTPEREPNSIRCALCNKITNTEDQYRMHCNGTQHIRKMKILNIPIQVVDDKMEFFETDMKFCEVCKITININNMESHEKGKIHKEKMVKKTHESAVFDEFHNCPRKRELSSSCEHFKSLKLTPRNYQHEIYEKSLKSDCVIFLPTGTGKTLVASMIILRMLEENPHHRVAFLVDKVLLVMQQHDFFKTQFENISMKRFDVDGVTNRKLRLIGLANSFLNTEHALSVRDHDIVVATAELFRGLLSNKNLFWEEFGLVILDEAHHCVKDHPYNKLLREYQLFPASVLMDQTDVHIQCQNGSPKVYENKLREWKNRRCKLVGLTASPAGTLDMDNTHALLLDLLKSLGGVDIVNVTEHKAELDEYTSNSNIETKLIGYSKNESNLRDILKTTFFFMIGKFERFILLNKNLIATKDCRKLSVEDVSDFKSQLKMRLQETESIQKSTINHILSVLNIIDDVDTFGYEFAWKGLKELLDNDNERVWFQDNTIQFIPKTQEIVSQPCSENSSVIQAIIEEARNKGEESRTILVLVRERETAHRFERELRKHCANQQLILLVGHGAGSGNSKKDNKGMDVKKQKKALDLIKGRSNQIIVATSVADEGIDLPDCDLVILINPPTSVQALVQVRGRARKKSSRLLMICRDQDSIDELKSLQTKEKNIIQSIELILAQNKK